MILNLSQLTEKYGLTIHGVIHVGAHYGEENPTYDQLNIQNRVFFEPVKNNFSVLEKNIAGRFPIHNIALGSENKLVEMYVETVNLGQSSSVLKPKLHIAQYPHIQFNERETVQMKRMDEIELDMNKFNFLNMDVQGYELEVLKGAKNTLESIDCIMTEINRAEVYEKCAQLQDLIEFLRPYGFKLVEEDWGGDTWGDGFFVKSKI